MLCEQGQVVSVEEGAVWVQTRRKSSCASCSARAGCGHALLDKFQNNKERAFIRASCSQSVEVGDQVEIGVPEQAVVRGSVRVYLWPLLALMAGIWLGHWAGFSEPFMGLTGFAALGLTFLILFRLERQALHQEHLQPVVIGITKATGQLSSH